MTNSARPSAIPVRHEIIAGLARVGGEDALPALSDLAGSDPNLAFHASFAQSVIAHRAGVAGYEPPTAAESGPLPAPADAPAWQALETDETVPDSSPLSGDTYGLIVGPSVAAVRCGWAPTRGRDRPHRTGQAAYPPTVAALVASKAESDGSLHTNMLALCSPAGDNSAHVAVHRTGETPAFTGSAQVSGTSVSFHLTAVRTPGARRATVSGTISSGVLQDLKISVGETLPKLSPELA